MLGSWQGVNERKKVENLCANGQKFKFSFILVTCTFPTRQIPNSGMDIRER